MSLPEVEPQNLDFDVIGDCEIIQRAAVRREHSTKTFGSCFPSRVWSAILNHGTSLRVRERIDRERATESAILEWVVSLCEIQEATGNMFFVESPVGASSWNQSSVKRLRNAPFSFEGISHWCTFGVKGSQEPKNSPQLLKFVVRKCPNKHVHGPVKGLTNAYRSSSRWHTRPWAQAVIRGVESDAIRRHEAYPAPVQTHPMMSFLKNRTLKRREFPKKYPVR